MLEIYHAPGTRGLRTIWACEELGIPYQVNAVNMNPDFRASPEWRKLNPVGKVPVMTDGDFVIYESCAMTQYVLDCYGEGRLQPQPGTREHGLYLQWCWFAESTFARPIGEIVNHRRSFGDDAMESVIDEMKGRARLSAQAVDAAVAGRTYLLDDEFTAADINMGYSIKAFLGVVKEALPANLAAYWDRLSARAAYQAADKANQQATL